MGVSVELLVFMLDEQRYGLELARVEKVLRAVEVAPLPSAPEIVLGVIDLAGRVIPVIDVRKRFRLPEKEITLNDQMVVARTAKRTVALIADSVSKIVEVPAGEVIHAPKILPHIEYVDGVARLEDGMVFIHDLDKFLSLEEDRVIDDAISAK